MKFTTLEDMNVKELKVLATEMGLEFKKNAGKAKMISILEAKLEVPVSPEVTRVEPVAEVIKEEEETEKMYLGKCVKTGKDLYR